MNSCNRNVHIEISYIISCINITYSCHHSFKPVIYNIFSIYSTFIFNSEKYRLFIINILNCNKLIIITIKNNCSIRIHRLKYFSLGFKNSVSCFKIFKVAPSDICNHTYIRTRNCCQPCHLTKITYSHLKHCNFITFLKRKNSKRKTYFIIKIPLCFLHFIFLCKNRCNCFFCTCFSDTSCDSDNFNIKLLSVISCKLL